MSEDDRFVLDLIMAHKNRLVRIVTSKLGASYINDVEDCLQDIFVLAFVNKEKLRAHLNPAGWLFVTANNVSYDMRRRNLKHEQHTVSFNDLLDYLGEDEVERYILERPSETEMEEGRKESVLDELCDKEKELYQLKYVEKKDNRYLAEYYSTTEGCIRARLSQLRKHVRKIIEKQMK